MTLFNQHDDNSNQPEKLQKTDQSSLKNLNITACTIISYATKILCFSDVSNTWLEVNRRAPKSRKIFIRRRSAYKQLGLCLWLVGYSGIEFKRQNFRQGCIFYLAT